VISPAEITGAILCGGAGTRLGRAEKPLTLLDDQPLVSHVRTRLAPQVGTVVISANEAATAYAAWGDRVIPDHVPGLGPLGGVVSLFPQCMTPFLFCCPGDAPFLPGTLVAELAAALDDPTVDLAVPHDGAQLQQLFLLCRAECSASLTTYLAEGRRAVRGWIDRQRAVVVSVPHLQGGFLNINSAEDLVLARSALASAPVSA
jgi:molybdenum cofactor guanylyltransferase